jgi:hypothetical protein
VPFIINNNYFLMNGFDQAGSGNTGWCGARQPPASRCRDSRNHGIIAFSDALLGCRGCRDQVDRTSSQRRACGALPCRA